MTADATRWGVLSTARINDLVLAGAAKSERVHMLAVASRDQSRADAYAPEKGCDVTLLPAHTSVNSAKGPRRRNNPTCAAPHFESRECALLAVDW